MYLVPLYYLMKNVLKIGFADYPHKYYVVFKNGKTVKFGHQDYEDSLYRTYRKYDKNYINERRRLYRLRHNKEKNQNIDTPGFLSYYVLW